MPSPLQSAEMSLRAYREEPWIDPVGPYNPFLEEFDLGIEGTGFTAHAFWSPETDSLVVAFAGTSREAPYLDILTGIQLAVSGGSNQTQQALDFTARAIAQASAWADGPMQVTVTGDSLGGWLALQVADQNPSVHAIAFNAPGFRGIDPEEFPQNATLYYNNPVSNDAVAQLVHDVGVKSYGDTHFVMEGAGHSITSLIEAWENGSATLYLDQYRDHVTYLLNSRQLPMEDLMTLKSVVDREFQAMIEQAIDNTIAPHAVEFDLNNYRAQNYMSQEYVDYLQTLSSSIWLEGYKGWYQSEFFWSVSDTLGPGRFTYTQDGFGLAADEALSSSELRDLFQSLDGHLPPDVELAIRATGSIGFDLPTEGSPSDITGQQGTDQLGGNSQSDRFVYDLYQDNRGYFRQEVTDAGVVDVLHVFDDEGRHIGSGYYNDDGHWVDTQSGRTYAHGPMNARVAYEQRGEWQEVENNREEGGKPILLDLNGDGQIDRSGLDHQSVFFDLDGDGYLEESPWIGRDPDTGRVEDGFLVADRNGDGTVQAEELVLTLLTPDDPDDTDLQALKTVFDTNGDGAVDARDTGWHQLRVWQDRNMNGEADAGELQTLAQRGITAIDVDPNGAWKSVEELSAPELAAWGVTAADIVDIDTLEDGSHRGALLDGDMALLGATGFTMNGVTRLAADMAFLPSPFGIAWSMDGEGRATFRGDTGASILVQIDSDPAAAELATLGVTGLTGNAKDNLFTVGPLLDGQGQPVDALLSGGLGNDTLTGGTGSDWLAGGPGRDTISGGDGADVLYIDAEDAGFHGGAGYDVAVVDTAHAVTLTLTDWGLESVLGNRGDDVLRAGNRSDDVVLSGGDGNDQLTGGGGQDLLTGGVGIDTLRGGDGDDLLFIDADDAVLDGGGGWDVAVIDAPAGYTLTLHAHALEGAFGTRFDDVLTAGAVTEGVLIGGGEGDDRLTGGDHDDTLFGDAGDDVLTGGAGNDYLVLADGLDSADGGAGTDRVSYEGATSGVRIVLDDPGQNGGEAAGDSYSGVEQFAGSGHDDEILGKQSTAHNDVFIGAEGNDILRSYGGNDVLMGGAGADVFDGGAGTDLVLYSDAPEGVTADLVSYIHWNTGIAVGDSYVSIENLAGSAFNDSLRGNHLGNHMWGGDGNDHLHGWAGNDTLHGEGGNDLLWGDGGADRLDGGEGMDRAIYTKSGAAVTVDLANPGNNRGEAQGDSYVSIENLQGTYHNDTLRGDGQANVIWGDRGDDVVAGAGGNDVLNGGEGRDRLDGGDGDDVLVIDAEDVSVLGGLGTDVVINPHDGGQTIDLTGTGAEVGVGGQGDDVIRAAHATAPPSVGGTSTGFLLALDLDGDGIVSRLAIEDSTAFYDMDDDGVREWTGWIGPDDGIVVFDGDRDGEISSTTDISFLNWDPYDSDVNRLRTAMDRLADLENPEEHSSEGALQNSELHGVRIWQDLNSDGIAQDGELSPFAASPNGWGTIWLNPRNYDHDEHQRIFQASGRDTIYGIHQYSRHATPGTLAHDLGMAYSAVTAEAVSLGWSIDALLGLDPTRVTHGGGVGAQRGHQRLRDGGRGRAGRRCVFGRPGGPGRQRYAARQLRRRPAFRRGGR